MSAPKYQAIEHQNIPIVDVENGLNDSTIGQTDYMILFTNVR